MNNYVDLYANGKNHECSIRKLTAFFSFALHFVACGLLFLPSRLQPASFPSPFPSALHCISASGTRRLNPTANNQTNQTVLQTNSRKEHKTGQNNSTRGSRSSKEEVGKQVEGRGICSSKTSWMKLKWGEEGAQNNDKHKHKSEHMKLENVEMKMRTDNSFNYIQWQKLACSPQRTNESVTRENSTIQLRKSRVRA